MTSLFYTAPYSEVRAAARYDAEYFQPSVIKILNQIMKKGQLHIRDHFNVSSGYPWKSQYFLDNTETGEPFVRIRDCKPGYIDIEDISKLDSLYANNEGVNKASPGDLVIGMDGVKYFYGSLIIKHCYINQRVAHLKSKKGNNIPAEYILLVINSPIGQKQLLREMTIAQTVGHITNENIRNLVMPSLAETKISQLVKMVNSSFTARAESRRLLDEAKRMVEEAVMGG